MNADEKRDKKIYSQNWKRNKKEINQAYPKNERELLLSIDKNIYNLLRTTRLNLYYLTSLNAYYNMEEIDMFMIDRIMSIVRETMKEIPSKNSLESLRTKKINKDFAPLFNLEKKYREDFYPIYKNKLEKARMLIKEDWRDEGIWNDVIEKLENFFNNVQQVKKQIESAPTFIKFNF